MNVELSVVVPVIAIVIQIIILAVGVGTIKQQSKSNADMIESERRERLAWQDRQKTCPVDGDCPGIFNRLSSDIAYIKGKIDEALHRRIDS